MKTEAKVGLFITISLFFLFGLLSQLSSFDNLFKKSYPIIAQIDDGTGLKEKAKVKLKGVDIGYVNHVTLVKNEVQAKLLIDEGVNIPSDSIITIAQDSLLGGKFLDIQPGKSSSMITENQLLSKEEKVSSIADASTSADEAFKEISLLVRDLRDIFNDGGKSDIQETLANLREFSSLLSSISTEDNKTIHEIIANANTSLLSANKTLEKFARMSEEITITSIAANKTVAKFSMMSDEITATSREYRNIGANINQDLPQIMARLESISKYLDSVSATLDKKLPSALDKFVKLEDNINDVVSTNKKSLSSALTSVDSFFAEGTETIKKVDDYLDGMIKSELHVEMRVDDVYDDGGYSRTHLNLALKPDPSRYYLIGIRSAPSFEEDSKFTRGFAGNEAHKSGEFLLSAQYGKRFDDLLFRLGILDNQGGAGIDYFALNDTLKLSADLSDFNAVNDIRGTNPNLTATVRYQFFKHINAYLSGNNLLNTRANSVSVGLGVSFVDNDLKNLLGTAASAAQ
jgi:phospholipid/cholesterol/gamma-HCH transport system substrate-binding protein